MSDEIGLGDVKRRRAEIGRELALLDGEISRLRAEDEELASAELVLSRLRPRRRLVETSCSQGGHVTHLPVAARRSENRPSHRACVLSVLADSTAVWVKPAGVVEVLERRWGMDVNIRSLRALLSLMKTEGSIMRQGRLIALPARVASAKAPERNGSQGKQPIQRKARR